MLVPLIFWKQCTTTRVPIPLQRIRCGGTLCLQRKGLHHSGLWASTGVRPGCHPKSHVVRRIGHKPGGRIRNPWAIPHLLFRREVATLPENTPSGIQDHGYDVHQSAGLDARGVSHPGNPAAVPPDSPRRLPMSTYVEIVAYILKANGMAPRSRPLPTT